MVLDKSINELIELVGHDGSEIIWPKLNEPRQRRGFTHQEFQYIAYNLGFVIPQYFPKFGCVKDETEPFVIDFFTLWSKILREYDGVLSGKYKGFSNAHAVAWNAHEGRIYDPSGHFATLEQFDSLYFHAAVCVGN